MKFQASSNMLVISFVRWKVWHPEAACGALSPRSPGPHGREPCIQEACILEALILVAEILEAGRLRIRGLAWIRAIARRDVLRDLDWMIDGLDGATWLASWMGWMCQ